MSDQVMDDQVIEEDVPGNSSTPDRPKARKSALQRNFSARKYRAFKVELEIGIPEAVSLDDFFEKHSQELETKIKEAVEEKKHDVTDPKVMPLSYEGGTIQVKLLYHQDNNLLALKHNLRKITSKIKEGIKEIGGPWSNIVVSVRNSDEMDQKVEEIRLVERSRCVKKQGMSGMHEEIILRLKADIARDLEVEKILSNLIRKEIFKSKDREAIQEETSRRARTARMLDILLKTIPDPFDDFVDILSDGTQKFLAINLLKEGSDDFPESPTLGDKLRHPETTIKDGPSGNKIVSKMSTTIDERYKELQGKITEKVNAIFREENQEWKKQMEEFSRDLENEIKWIKDEAAKKHAPALENEREEKNLQNKELLELQKKVDTNKKALLKQQGDHNKDAKKLQEQFKEVFKKKCLNIEELTKKNEEAEKKLLELQDKVKTKDDQISRLDIEIEQKKESLNKVTTRLENEELAKSRLDKKLEEKQKENDRIKVSLEATRILLKESRKKKAKPKKKSKPKP